MTNDSPHDDRQTPRSKNSGGAFPLLLAALAVIMVGLILFALGVIVGLISF
ncbi:MAG: hypothetical protein ACRDFQ_05540 [Anaerolineales bacterium]